jgi:DNA modification methylase
MTDINIFNGDAVKWAKEYKGPLFHALLCDPPYHLTTITKRFGGAKSAPAKHGKDGVFARASRGFMGQQWDGGDVAFQPDTWAAFGEVMHPGAFGMAFASSRGWHRLAVAIEDAGFIIHPSIFGWAFGSGFPKATRIPDERFSGHRYGLQALKPALEPIIVFQKPFEGRPRDNITQTGAGTLNIDAGRIGTDEIPSNQWTDGAHPFGNGAGNDYETEINAGRWPANFILMDGESAAALDKQSGHLVSGEYADHHVIKSEFPFGSGERSEHPQAATYGDSGGASRFFYQVQEQIDYSDPVYYCAKPGKEEKDAGLRTFDALSIGDGRPSPIDNAYQCGKTERQNPHPTVKPIDLSRYLAGLLLPPEDFTPRRILVPFSGVASEVIGAMQAGWDEIQGVELTDKYIPIAEARIEYWRNKGFQKPLF